MNDEIEKIHKILNKSIDQLELYDICRLTSLKYKYP